MRSADRSMARCMCFTPIGWRRCSRQRCSPWRSWRAMRPCGPASWWAMGRCATPTRSPVGSGPLRRRSRACPPRRPRTDVLPKRRPDGRRATAGHCPIRPARLADVGDVAAIERAVFSDPWSANDFAECVASGVPFLVAERRAVVAGYVVAHCAADEGEILNLGVAVAYRLQGIARALVERVLEALAGRGVRTVYLEVRTSNASARRLYESLGFGEVARRAHYYRRPVEDAVVLRAAIPAERGSAKL